MHRQAAKFWSRTLEKTQDKQPHSPPTTGHQDIMNPKNGKSCCNVHSEVSWHLQQT